MDYQPQNASSYQSQGEGDEGEGFDWRKLAEYGRFVAGSLGRRKLIVFLVFSTVFGLTYLGYWLMPRTYHVETQLLAQRNQVIGNLAVSGRSMPDQGAPTRAAAETVLRRDNLIALIQQADLVANWDASRSRASKLKGWLWEKLGRTTSDLDKADIILGTLETRLAVKTNPDYQGEGTVTISIEWPDPKMGYRLVTAAQQSFIEARHLSEISSISEALSILVTRATSMRREIDGTLRSIEEKKAAAKGPKRRIGGGSSARLPIPDATTPAEREAIQQIAAMIDEKKLAIKDLDDMRRRRIAELQTKLAELRATYAESHPAILDVIQTIETLSQESPQMLQLKKDEANLQAQYQARVAKTTQPVEKPTAPVLQDSAAVRAQAAPAEDDDREMEFAKNQLRFQADAYARLLERLESARMEQETARAAFKYRYVVIHPAQIPREAIKPKPAKILGGGFAAALVLALLSALLADLRSGRVFAPWQLEKALRLPVLAEIRRER